MVFEAFYLCPVKEIGIDPGPFSIVTPGARASPIELAVKWADCVPPSLW